jgi:hypothetical protein
MSENKHILNSIEFVQVGDKFPEQLNEFIEKNKYIKRANERHKSKVNELLKCKTSFIQKIKNILSPNDSSLHVKRKLKCKHNLGITYHVCTDDTDSIYSVDASNYKGTTRNYNVRHWETHLEVSNHKGVKIDIPIAEMIQIINQGSNIFTNERIKSE